MRRLFTCVVVAASLGLAAPASWAQDGTDQPDLPPAPTDRRPRLGNEPEPEPATPPGATASDGSPALARRRPIVTPAVLRGRDISLEVDGSIAFSGIDGDAHEGALLDYDDLYDGAAIASLRFALPLRFVQRSTVSLWAGPVLEIGGGTLQGQSVTFANGDVLIADDLPMSRVIFGGLFRAEVGRWFFEGWGGFGVGHTGRADATFDQTASGGSLTPFTLYNNSSMGVVCGALRVGVNIPAGRFVNVAIWGTVGGWAMGAPEDAGSTVLPGAANPKGMAGAYVGMGITLGFGLGDWPAARSAAPAEREYRRLR